MTAVRFHDWGAGGVDGAYACRRAGCEATYPYDVSAVCLAPAALSSRLDALLDEARALSADLRAARDAAPDGGKAGYRLANNRVERAIEQLSNAAAVSL